MHVKTQWSMFKMKTDDHNFRTIVATDKNYILRKKSLEFRNSKSDISCKIAFYIFSVINWNSLEKWMRRKHKWINQIVHSNFLKHLNYTKLPLETVQ